MPLWRPMKRSSGIGEVLRRLGLGLETPPNGPETRGLELTNLSNHSYIRVISGSHKTRLSVLDLFVLISGMVTGCDNESFAVVAPAFRNETGTALISVSIPPFLRGLIHRVSISVTAEDTGRIRAIKRDMNFPIPGGNLAVSQMADIPPGRRCFNITAFDTADTRGVPRFQGFADSTVIAGQTKLVQVKLNRVGGVVNSRGYGRKQFTEGQRRCVIRVSDAIPIRGRSATAKGTRGPGSVQRMRQGRLFAQVVYREGR